MRDLLATRGVLRFLTRTLPTVVSVSSSCTLLDLVVQRQHNRFRYGQSQFARVGLTVSGEGASVRETADDPLSSLLEGTNMHESTQRSTWAHGDLCNARGAVAQHLQGVVR